MDMLVVRLFSYLGSFSFFAVILISALNPINRSYASVSLDLSSQYDVLNNKIGLYLDRVKYPKVVNQNPDPISEDELRKIEYEFQILKKKMILDFHSFPTSENAAENQKSLGRLVLIFQQLARYAMLVSLYEANVGIVDKKWQSHLKSIFDGNNELYTIRVSFDDLHNSELLELMGRVTESEEVAKLSFKADIEYDQVSQIPSLVLTLNPNYFSEIIEQKIIQQQPIGLMPDLANYMLMSLLLKNYNDMYFYNFSSVRQLQFSDPQLQILSLAAQLSKSYSIRPSIVSETYKETYSQSSQLNFELSSYNFELDSFFIDILKLINPDLKNKYFIGDEPEIKKGILEIKEAYREKTIHIYSRLISLLEPSKVTPGVLKRLYIYAFQFSGEFLFGNSSTLTMEEKNNLNLLINNYKNTFYHQMVINKTTLDDLSHNLNAFSNQKILRNEKQQVRAFVLKIAEIFNNVDHFINGEKVDLILTRDTVNHFHPSVVFTKEFQSKLDSVFQNEDWVQGRNQYFEIINEMLKTKSRDYHFLKKRLENFDAVNDQKIRERYHLDLLRTKTSFKEYAFQRNLENRKNLENYLFLGVSLGFFNESFAEAPTLNEFIKSSNQDPSFFSFYKERFKVKQMTDFPILKWSEENKIIITEKNVDEVILKSSRSMMNKNLNLLDRLAKGNNKKEILNQNEILSEVMKDSLKMGLILTSTPGVGLIYSDWLKNINNQITSYSLWRHLNDDILGPAMLSLIGYQLFKFIIKYPLPKSSSFLKTFDYAVLDPIFGSKFSRFNKIILASIGADIFVQGHDVFVSRPEREAFLNTISKSNLIQKSPLITLEDLERVQEENLEMKNMFWVNRAFDGVFLFGLSAGYVFYKNKLILPSLRRDLESVKSSLNKIGFTSQETVPYDDYIDLAAEATINNIKDFSSVSPEILSTKTSMKDFIKKESQQVKDWLHREELRWQRLSQRHYYQFLDLGATPGDWNPERIQFQYEELKRLYQSGHLSRSDFVRKEEAFRDLWNALDPVLILMKENPFYGQVYRRVWTNVLGSTNEFLDGVLKSRTAYKSEFYVQAHQDLKMGFEKTDVNGFVLLRPEAQRKMTDQEWEYLKNITFESTEYSKIVNWLWH